MKPKKSLRTSFIKTLFLALNAVGLMCAAANLQAAEIQGVTVASYSSQANGTPVIDSVTNLVSGVGLFGDAHIAVPGGAMWYSGAGVPGANFVTFNLGGVYTLNAIKVWNYNDSSSAANVNIGISNAAISYSTDGINFTTNIASQNLIRGQGLVNTFGLPYVQTITMPSPITASYIRINARVNWAGNQTSGAGLSKVRFISNTNPPTVLGASENFGNNQVTVVFSESVDSTSALNPANYSVSGATISSVTPGEYIDRVILHTSPLTGSPSVTVSGVYDEALTATVTNNSTVPVKSEVYLWLKADQGVTTTPMFGGNMLTAWADQSGYGHNAGPANLFNLYTNQPFLVSSAINGKPAIAFYGTNVMQIPNDPANPINGDFTLFMVVEKTTTTTAGYPISKLGGFGGGNNSNNYAAPFDIKFDNVGDGRPAFSIGNNAASGNTLTSPGTITENNPTVAAFSVTATNSGSIAVNGSQYVVGAFNTAPQDGGGPINLGIRGDGLTASLGNTFSGYIAEVILIRGTITPADVASIDSYLATKYGITLVPPSIVESPASVAAQVGHQATFWVNATNLYLTSTPGYVPANDAPYQGGLFPLPFTYQWQSNGVPIFGATNAVYTTPNLTLSANGASYTATVTSTLGSGSANSSPATLSVVPDTTPPGVFSATKTASVNNILVVFSEAVDSGTGLNAANYSLNGGVSISSAVAGASPNQVILTTSTLDTNAAYLLTVKNVQDVAGNTMAAAMVSVMPSAMTMWLRGDSGIVTNGSLVVNEWLDQTANGNNAVTYPVPVANRPSVGVDPVNNLPGVKYTLANKQWMVVNDSPSTALTGNMTIYMVANVGPDYTTYRELLSKNAGGFAAPYEINYTTGSGTLRFSRGDGVSPGSGTAQSGSATPKLNNPNVVSCIGGPGLAVNTYVNGYTLAYSGNFSVPFADNLTPLYLGTRNSFDLFMGGDIQEVMLFTNAISLGDRTNVDNYFGAKYFTFTCSGPTNATVTAGETATFSVTATQGSAHFAYQWMEIPATNTLLTNAIPGATSSTYTTPPTRVSDNNDNFFVLVYVPGTTTTNVSATATLTVISVPPIVQTYGSAFWGSNTVAVTFQTPLDPSAATNLANYSLGGATVLSATLVSPTEVILTTTPLNSPPYTLHIQNLDDNNGAVMSPTNCLNVSTTLYPPNIDLWLRADKGVTSSGGDVSEWDDQSGNGNNFTDAGGSSDPTLVSNALNGLPALLFNGTNETYMYAGGSAPSLALTGDMTIFAVMNFTTYLNPSGTTGIGGGGEIISKNDEPTGTFPAPWDYYAYYGGGFAPLLLRGNGTVGQTPFAGAATSPSTGLWHELSAMSQGNQELHRVDGRPNGNPITWSVTGGVVNDPNDYVFIGTRADGAIRLTGYMAELMVVGSALSTYDTSSMETYFGSKYGVLASPGLLGITQTNAATATIYWPAPQWSFVLQSTPSLVPASWSNVTAAVTTINGTNVVSVPATNSYMYYRLESQSQ